MTQADGSRVPAKGHAAHVSTVHHPFDTRIFQRQARSLAQHGWSVTVLSGHPMAPSKTIGGVLFVRLRVPARRVLRIALASLVALAPVLRTRADVYHLHDPELVPLGLMLRLLGRVVVFDMHEYYSAIADATSHGIRRRLFRSLFRLTTESLPNRALNGVVFATAGLAEAVRPGRAARIVVYNLPQVDVVGSGMEDARVSRAVFVGTISPPRMRVMLDAARRASKVVACPWVFVGVAAATVSWARSRDPELVRSGIVEFRQRMPLSDLMVFLSQSLVAVNYHPSERRFDVALPVKVLEYAAAGCCPVTSDFDELRRFLRPGVDYLVANGPEELAEHVVWATQHAEAAQEVGASARASVAKHADWAEEARKLDGFYSRLVLR